MRVIFIGASSFGLKCLEYICNIPEITVVGALTNPRDFSISYSEKKISNFLHANILRWSSQRNLPCYEMTTTMHEDTLQKWIFALKPDLFVVAGWYHIIPKKIREIAPAVGLHASLLPDYSGGAPLVWAMINGEKKTGITLFQMDDGVDSGPIIGQAAEPVFNTDTIASLYSRIEVRGIELLAKYLPEIAKGVAIYTAQNESQRRIFAQRSPQDGRIDWNQGAGVIDRFIRAQTRPYPGAFTELGVDDFLTIWSAKPLKDNYGRSCSSVIKKGKSFIVQCFNSSLLLQEIEYKGKVYTIDNMDELLNGFTKFSAE